MRIVLACGGTGGHIFPAISVAEELERRGPDRDIVYICGRRDIEDAIFRVVDPKKVFPIQSAPFRGGLSVLHPGFIIRNLAGFFSALALFLKERPSLVVGFGGHTSFPAICAAKLLGLRTMLHEQNAAPGRANRLMAGLVDRVALSYPESRQAFSGAKDLRVTGNPIRASIETAERLPSLEFFGFDPSKRTLLVLGGSQGAESINRFFLEALPLLAAECKRRLQVLHLCGKMAPEQAESRCRAEGVPSRAYSFFERMDLAYGASDAALGRAGATFLAEIEVRGLPAVLIPYPFAGAHQLENAKAFARSQKAVVIEQKDVTAAALARHLETLLSAAPAPKAASPAGAARRALADYIEGSIR